MMRLRDVGCKNRSWSPDMLADVSTQVLKFSRGYDIIMLK